ncbi:5'/3'-nucleotidase SurE [Oscillatoria sp. FACHB-1406]|uniref:5'/3'-nucleotidase SurE n=1 Tax=Oscillatoria sp. FACHB-1406 TaxID=2692846 RepID=UPI0016883E83|nr:5'/3'-nucleotidase SurE [Oscillatoria sp. FACHB-1406]MBD2576230.1 5'/3'-nucleotidase SurE [Oscillatoria sp. FACHB-1406]
MTLILTNDDGIDAPGIRALHNAIGGKGIFFAPQAQLSGCGHQTTTHLPISVEKRSDTEYAVGGTPADCTRIALRTVPKIDWVLSGINAGGNLGVDVYISGTVAAVREAAIHGIPGIAISHWIKSPLRINWDEATQRATKVLEMLFALPLPPYSFWNVNLPHLEPGTEEPEIVFCPLSKDPLPVEYRREGDLYHYTGKYGLRDRTPGTDVDVCFSGNISITQISL